MPEVAGWWWRRPVDWERSLRVWRHEAEKTSKYDGHNIQIAFFVFWKLKYVTFISKLWICTREVFVKDRGGFYWKGNHRSSVVFSEWVGSAELLKVGSADFLVIQFWEQVSAPFGLSSLKHSRSSWFILSSQRLTLAPAPKMATPSPISRYKPQTEFSLETIKWFLYPLTWLKKALSGCPWQVDLPAGHVAFHSHCSNGQGMIQVIWQLHVNH